MHSTPLGRHKLVKPAGSAHPPTPSMQLEALIEHSGKWKGVWQGGESKEQAVLPQVTFDSPLTADALLADEFDGLSLEGFRLALRWYPANKARGADNWDVKLLLALPDCALMCFLVWFRACQRQGKWPDWFLLNLMALLPKPNLVDFRTVAKTPQLYRIWGAQRRGIVKDWEVKVAARWDVARPGSSSLDAAFTRSVKAETALLCGKHVGCVLWDFTHFLITSRSLS